MSKPDEHLSEADAANGLDRDVANHLSRLSEPGDGPEGMGVPTGAQQPFSADEVDFESADWLLKLLAVQQWLCLDATIAPTESPANILKQLFDQIASGKPLAQMAAATPFPSLTEAGLQRLESYLARAVDLRESLEAERDELGKTLADENWRSQWDEWRDQSKRQPGRIIAKVDAWKIKSFRGYAEDGELDLNPSYQRGDVWSLGESQALVESILLGIPLPSVILSKERERDTWQIVDGKQRLTAILRFIGRHPGALAYKKQLTSQAELFDTDFRKLANKKHLTKTDLSQNYLPFPLPKYEDNHPLAAFSRKYYCEIRNEKFELGGKNIKIGHIFENEGADYKIPVIVYEDTQIQDIHHVFGLYNRQGRKLNAEELRNAVYHHLLLTRLFLLLGGDRGDADGGKADSYLTPELFELAREVGQYIEQKNIGTARFKRTKLIGWALSILAHRPGGVSAQEIPLDASKISTPSTAKHIDSLLEHLTDQNNPKESLALLEQANLRKLAEQVCLARKLHERISAGWHPHFTNKARTDSKWDELPFVASLVSCILLSMGGVEDLSDEKVEGMRAFTKKRTGPNKSQNKTQWGFIARVTMGLVEFLNVDKGVVGKHLVELLGYNCLPVLDTLAAQYMKTQEQDGPI